MEEAVLVKLTLENGEKYEGDDIWSRMLFQHDYESVVSKFPTIFSKTPEDLQALKSALDCSVRPCDLQMFGIACLQLFVQVNWTGGRAVQEQQVLPWLDADTKKYIIENLIEDGDSLVEVAKLEALLGLARLILMDCRDMFAGVYSAVWCVRCALAVQSILQEKSAAVYSLVKLVLGELETCTLPADVQPVLHLLGARINYMFHDVREAERFTDLAAASVGLRVGDTGALGKRTRYQQKDLAQFTLDLEISSEYTRREESAIDASLLPTDLKLNDDLRLEKIQFCNSEREQIERLDSVQQCVLLSRFFLKKRLLPLDDLTAEELMPHLTVVLEHPVSWSVHMTALFNRCRLESKSRRTVERARAQLETLMESYISATAPELRMRHCHESGLPPTWELEKELGSVLLSLGSVKAALDCYLKLESWDEVIVCYNMLQMRHKSAEVIKTRLEEKETPRLWCQLGDATDNLECYHKALQMSKNKSARAFKSLGLHYYFMKEYTPAIEYFKKSLVCSRFQLDVLLRLGYAALESEKWDEAAQGYRNYCALESDNFEAWNNLAKCYIKLNQKERAWRVLQEAVRCDYDNWRVWDNLMVISTDLGAFEESMRAYNRILDIKKTHTDEQILSILTKSVIDCVKDSSGESSSKHRAKLQKLLARLTVCQPRDPVAWNQYGVLLTASQEGDPTEELVKGCQCLQKSIACYTGAKGWDKEQETCTKVLLASQRLVSSIFRADPVHQVQLANSTRLSLASSLKLIEQSQTNINTGVLVDTLAEEFNRTRDSVQHLLDWIAEAKKSG